MPVRNIREIKIQLRSKIKKQRTNMEPLKRERMDADIRKRLFSLWQYKSCRQLFVYVSKDIEVDTKQIILQALEDGKKVAAPRCITEGSLMDFYYISSLADLEKGTFGVLEPKPDVCRKATDFSDGVCIVPGLSFDSEGYRLGYGKGYYDRFLNDFDGCKIGICYSACVKWELPHGFYDRPVDLLVTERYFRKIHKEKRLNEKS